MNAATLRSLTAAEQALMTDTERPRLLEHDEEALLGVFERVRKQRAKALSQYRRGASARVEAKGARGAQRVAGAHRDALKAELWEDALARVSRQLAVQAKASATALKRERLASARGDERAGRPTPAAPRVTTAKATKRVDPPSPIERKVAASSKSSGKRRQAARDTR